MRGTFGVSWTIKQSFVVALQIRAVESELELESVESGLFEEASRVGVNFNNFVWELMFESELRRAGVEVTESREAGVGV